MTSDFTKFLVSIDHNKLSPKERGVLLGILGMAINNGFTGA